MSTPPSTHDRARRLRAIQRYGRVRTALLALRTGRSREQVVEDALREAKRRAE